MTRKSRGLGRGLDMLLPDDSSLETSLVQISIDDIDPNPDQPRQVFPEEALQELAVSIREQGVLQPLLVIPTEGDRYRIVAGERRWRASRLAGLEQVPCIVRSMEKEQEMEIALIENLQREDLNPLEQAVAIRALMDECGYTQEAVASRLGKSRPAVANLLRMLSLPAEVQLMVREGTLSAGHARVLCGLESREKKLQLARLAVEKGLSVRELEAMAAAGSIVPDKEKKPAARLSVELQGLQEQVLQATGLQTVIKGNEKKGKITLTYSTAQELEAFYEWISAMGSEE